MSIGLDQADELVLENKRLVSELNELLQKQQELAVLSILLLNELGGSFVLEQKEAEKKAIVDKIVKGEVGMSTTLLDGMSKVQFEIIYLDKEVKDVD